MHALDYFCTVYKIQNKQLANFLGCKPPQINDWKKGRRPIPKKYIKDLCDLFSVSVEQSYLFSKNDISKQDMYQIKVLLKKAEILHTENLTDEMRSHLEMELLMAENHHKILLVTQELEKELGSIVLFSDKLDSKLEQVKKLIEDLRR
ncbi:helix-turn-helix domain-containing protein [Halalkalibacter sp. APA_J-10(15)]|uniref:helix-turn-helix domain-containing protein n=1 Tax=Halalkalibacter sp. APA_J-10(15) TaxID=2933805 RepID=UPI001FF153A4|nr:helix-turn-helix domain-containing protein [Halalkalibacter sp. APA_J-10(15)]MCK0470861.1 helix-turn-helix domain-containing protein [Halalkalibacter sp. APA_J-10(15)]